MNHIQKYSKKYLPLLVLISFLVSCPLYANSGIKDAVNMAGKQRMLTQSMLKNYTMSGMNITFGEPDKKLQQNINLFDEAIKELEALQLNAQVNDSLSNVQQLWLPIKKILHASPEKEKVSALQKDLDVLLAACQQTTELIATSSGEQTSDIINLSGRQRMLSQRLAALYMLQVWGIADPEFKDKLNATLDEFGNAQTTLLQSKQNTPEINTGLAKVKKQFKWFEVMGRSKSGRYVPSIISKYSDKILNEMNVITSLYIKAL